MHNLAFRGLRLSRLGAMRGGISLPSIDAEGWRYTYPDPLTTYDPVGSPITITVTSPGFSAAAASASVTRVLPITGRIDKLNPNEGVLTPNVSLAERVYKDCTIPEVTNNSTHNYLQPQAVWLTKDRQRATGTNFDVELLVTHGHARSGRAVAGVRFIATDESANSVTVDVNATTLHTWSVTSFRTDAFKAAIPLAGLAQGDVITIDAIIYPWVGEAWQISVDSYAYGSGMGLTTLKAVNDRTGGYGTVYAYVTTTGNDSTGVASATPATAASDPFLTCSGALAAVRTFNNTNHSRLEPGGAILRLGTGDFTWGGYTATSDAVQDMVCVLEPDGAASPVIKQVGTNYFSATPRLMEFKGIEIRNDTAGNRYTFSKPDDSWVNLTIFDGVSFNLNGNGVNAAMLYRGGRRYFYSCTGDQVGQTSSFATRDAMNTFGCSANWCGDSIMMNMVGCRIDNGKVAGNDIYPETQGRVHACNYVTLRGTGEIQAFRLDLGERGYGRICNIFEYANTDGGGQRIFGLWADGITVNALNVVCMLDGCYASGQIRVNMLYGVGNGPDGASILKEGVVKFCIWNNGNIKGDSFEDNGSNTNQSVRYGVNMSSNVWYNGNLGGQVAGYNDNYRGDIVQMRTVYGTYDENPLIVMDFADPKYFGTGADPLGNGDYTPGASYAGALIPAGFAPCAHDIYGRAIPNDGTAFAGPVQAAP